MTRAREELYLSYAAERTLYGGRQHNPPSRFLSDIDGAASLATQDPGLFGGAFNSFSQPSANDEPRYVPELEEGDGVKHRIFGVGTVVELDGENATIYFKGKGTKRLNIAFAPLEKLS
jgi:DNA helicase-2/ATP-dependent DNA helicase PcrA